MKCHDIFPLSLILQVQQAISFNHEVLDVGEGNIPTVRIGTNIPTDFILIPQSMHLQESNFIHLINQVYSDIEDNSNNNEYFVDKAILTAKNKDLSTINDLLLKKPISAQTKSLMNAMP